MQVVFRGTALQGASEINSNIIATDINLNNLKIKEKLTKLYPKKNIIIYEMDV